MVRRASPLSSLACRPRPGPRRVAYEVRLEAGGDRVRLRLTNELGLWPVRVGDVHLAPSSPNRVLETGTGTLLLTTPTRSKRCT